MTEVKPLLNINRPDKNIYLKREKLYPDEDIYLYKELAKERAREKILKRKRIIENRGRYYKRRNKIIKENNLKKLIITLKVRGATKYDIPEFLPSYIENSNEDISNKIYFDTINNLNFSNIKKFYKKNNIYVYDISNTKSLFTNVIFYEKYLKYIKLLESETKQKGGQSPAAAPAPAPAPEPAPEPASDSQKEENMVDIEVVDEDEDEDEDEDNDDEDEDKKDKDKEDKDKDEEKKKKELTIINNKITKKEYNTTINNIDYIIKSFFSSKNKFNFYNKKYLIHSYLWDDNYKLTGKGNIKILVTLYVYQEDVISDKKYTFNRQLSCKIQKDKLYNDFLDLLGYKKEINEKELKYRIKREREKDKRKDLVPLDLRKKYKQYYPYQQYQNNLNRAIYPYQYYNVKGGYNIKNKSKKYKNKTKSYKNKSKKYKNKSKSYKNKSKKYKNKSKRSNK